MTIRKSLVIVLLLSTAAGAMAAGEIITRHMRHVRRLTVDHGQLIVAVDAVVEQPITPATLPMSLDVDFADPSYWHDATSQSDNEIEQLAYAVDSTPDDAPVTPDIDVAATSTVRQAPQQLPLLPNAQDISQRSDSEDAERIVRDAMPDATDADRAIWLNQLNGMSPEEIRFLMSQRQRLGSSVSPNAISDHADPRSTQPSDNPNATQTAAALLQQNLAHSNTIGYRQRVLLYSARRDTNDREFSLRIDQSPGRMMKTGRQLDLAIDGSGFFCLYNSSGQKWYCRSAPFVFRNEQIVLDEGVTDDPLILVDGIPADVMRITIASDGAVIAELADQRKKAAGRIRLFTFFDSTQLHPVGQSLFVETSQSGNARIVDAESKAAGQVIQGSLEQSNVDGRRQRAKLRLLELRNQANDSRPFPPPASVEPIMFPTN